MVTGPTPGLMLTIPTESFMRHPLLIVCSASLFLVGTAMAETTITMHKVSPQGTAESIGEVAVSESAHGLVFTPRLKGLEAGLHGFHIHENPNCDPAEESGKTVTAGAAGGH